MSAKQRDSASVTVRFAVADADSSNPALRQHYLESSDLEDHETLRGLFAWMYTERHREQLRTVLAFDLFEVWDDFLHYRSEDPLSVYLHHGSTQNGARWRIPRPPLIEILDDWEEFLRTPEPFEKTYTWTGPRPSDFPSGRGYTFDPSGADAVPVTVHFDLEARSGGQYPTASTDNTNSEGRDRLSAFFRSLPFDHHQLAASLAERTTLSVWTLSAVFLCSANEVRLWADYEDPPDDFALLRRDQFEAMIQDWIAFVQDPRPTTKTYT